jgi:hypothetical protein
MAALVTISFMVLIGYLATITLNYWKGKRNESSSSSIDPKP